MNRRAFLRAALGSAMVTGLGTAARAQAPSRGPRPSDFVFARLRYESGDWDYNPKVAANVLNAVVEYTNIPVHADEVIIGADSTELLAFPFLFMTGHTLVRFNRAERRNLARFVELGGFLFSDDCNHDVNGLYARSFAEEARLTFGHLGRLGKLPTAHPLYRCFFTFPEGPPATSHELNGWGDNIVHDYLEGVSHEGRCVVLHSLKDYGCEWDYDWRNKRFRRDDNTRFAVNIVVYAMTS